MVKKLILVTSPPACGKTYISKALAARLEHVVYLDKDTLITLSKQIFKVANQPYNRSSQFFEDNIRDYEYDFSNPMERMLPQFMIRRIVAVGRIDRRSI